MKKNSFLFHKMLYYGIDEGNLMFENQSISNNPSVGNLIFLKNIIKFFDKPLSFSKVTKIEGSKIKLSVISGHGLI